MKPICFRMRGSEWSSIFFLSLICLNFLLLFPPAFAADSDIITDSAFLSHICSSFDNYTDDTPYASNLKLTFDQLASDVPPSGFGLASFGKDFQTQVNGLALCRGDVSRADCENCVVTANQEIQHRCPHKRAAAIWYDFCLLKYSNFRFFGKIDNRNKFALVNVKDSDNPATFNTQVKNLLTSLSEKVQTTKNLYVIGDVEIQPSMKLYGLVQCTRDLSTAACKKCLDNAIGELPQCCDGKIGGRVISGSCNFRYEVYPIVDAQK